MSFIIQRLRHRRFFHRINLSWEYFKKLAILMENKFIKVHLNLNFFFGLVKKEC